MKVSRSFSSSAAAATASANSSRIVSADPLKPFPGFQPLFAEERVNTYEITQLPSGVTVLTENSGFPFHTELALLCRMGSRNETAATAGAMKMVTNLLHLAGDEQSVLENYEINKLNGGGLNMISDQESALFRCSCNPEDTETMMKLLLKTSLQPKDFSMLDASCLEQEIGNEDFDTEFRHAAFGGSGPGKSGVNPNMTQEDFLKFQEMYLTPQRVIISAANVPSHKYFVDLVQRSLASDYKQFLGRQYNPNHTATVYAGQDRRIETESDLVDVGIGFNGVNWMHEDVIALQIVYIMFGSSSSFSSGGPGKGMHSRASKNLLNIIPYVSGAGCYQFNYTDGGLFGLKVQGAASNLNDIVDCCINELLLLTQPISPIELQRSKNCLKSLMFLSLERQQDRLEEVSKHIQNFKRIRLSETEQLIDRVTSQDINRIITRLIRSSRPTITMIGDGVKKGPSFDKIGMQFLKI